MTGKNPLEEAGNSIITSDDILGKDVVDFKGDHIGIVTQLHINKEDKTIVGISIDTGFMKPEVFVGINLIRNFGIDSVFISEAPSTKFIGMIVFDVNGQEVGKVSDADVKGIKVNEITVSVGFKKVVVLAKDIKNIGVNVILKVTQKSLKEKMDEKETPQNDETNAR